MEEDKKRISCRRCQLRKLKCTRLQPCDNCVNSGNDCTFRDDDTRRRPVNRAYVNALEERLATYEAAFKKMNQQMPDSPLNLLAPDAKRAPVVSSLPPRFEPELIFDYSGSSRVSTLTLRPNPQGHRSFHGPTSIYQKGCITEQAGDDLSGIPTLASVPDEQDIFLSGIFKLDERLLYDSLLVYFRHLNAECIFVDGEALVRDFYRDKHGGKFWSYPLLYAACCLGTRTSNDQRLSTVAAVLEPCVHRLLNVKMLQAPGITTVQSLLCLSLLECGAGNISRGWVLSGMAFRMVQDIGLHQDPKFLTQDDKTLDLVADGPIRRRVYWGCYIYDKILSLHFGRPLCLRDEDASVDPYEYTDESNSEELSDASTVDPSVSALLDGIGLSSRMLVQLIGLGSIIEAMMKDVFSTKLIKLFRRDLVAHRVMKLEELNIRLFRWHAALPEPFTWSQWTATTEPLPLQVVITHALYHSCIIALNRHFMRPTPGFALKTQSRERCLSSADSIVAITRHYRTQHSLDTAPLILVYSLGMAASAVLFASNNGAGGAPENTPSALDGQLHFIHKALRECSKTYAVALQLSDNLGKGKSGTRSLAERKASHLGDNTLDLGEAHKTLQLSPRPISLQDDGQTGADSWAAPWWGDEAPGMTSSSGGAEALGEMEGDMVSNFTWSNVFM